MGYDPIHEVSEGRNWRIKEFYWKLWFGDNEALPEIDIRDTFDGSEVTITTETVERFCAVVGNQGEQFKLARHYEDNFPKAVDSDLLKLIHLSNGFKMVEGATPLLVGDVCKGEARIASVTNSESGKAVKVTGFVMRDGKAIIEVIKPEYVVKIGSAVGIGVLGSKEWFEWDDDSALKPDTTLIFKVKSEYKYKAKATYSSVAVEGSAYIRNQLKELVKVATVSYSTGHAHGNLVLSYLSRHGEVQGDIKKLDGNGYTLTSSAVSSSFIALATNEPYSKISGDFNPIHINPYFSDYAVLPGNITHGMWSNAATRKYVENVVVQGRPERVRQHDVSFVGMVFPGNGLTLKLTHCGMCNGNLVIRIETNNQCGEHVLSGTVAQVPTAYVFTDMGMELNNNSPAAHAVWEAADAHLLAVYGISIVDIVKNNPKEKTIHFGGIKGQAIRQRYMDMSYDTTDKDGNVKTPPFHRYPRSHSPFAQIALVVTEKAAFEDMKSKRLVQKDCAFAGHSLGEYSALASIVDVLAISALVDVVFYRGITMQRAVERDEHNRSNYAMCAVNPSRIGKCFNDAALCEVVDSISRQTDMLLEIVNYNVEGQQYVKKIDIQRLTEQFTVEQVKEMLKDIITSCLEKAKEKQKAEGYIKLERGFATIPLSMPFRAYLFKKINPLHLNPDLLIDKYIPNLIAKPFEVLTNWDQDNSGSPEQRQKLAYTILVELLTYQFASPVRWIQTQDLLFTQYTFERLVELGPGPTLTGMANRTLKANRVRQILCHAKHPKEIYYQFEGETVDAPTQTVVETPAPAAASAPVAAPAPLKAVDTLRVIVAQKLKKKVDEVPINNAIKDLLESSSVPEKGEELPLDELGAALSMGYTGTLGKHTNGFTHLNKTWGLDPARSDAALLLGVTMEPAKRLGSEAEVKSWLDPVAAEAGITLTSGGGGVGAAAGGGTVMNSEEFLKFQAEQQLFAAQHIELYMRYLKRDSRAGARAYDEEKVNAATLQAKLDDIAKEHGDAYIQGIQPIFEPLKACHFNSSWNWVRQDALLMWYDIIFGHLTTVDREITSRCIVIINCADPTLVRYMQYYIDDCHSEKGETYALAKQFGQQLIDNCREVLGQPPLYHDVTFPTAPKTEVNEKGDIMYSEVVREGVRKLGVYVEKMASGDNIPGNVNIQEVHDDVLKLWNVVNSQPEISQEQKSRIKSLYDVTSLSADKIPLLHLQRKVGGNWEYSNNLTGVYLDVLHEIATSGTSFKDKNALLTGVGKGSIGVEILKGLFQGGAQVVITTSRYSRASVDRASVEYYQGIYHRCGSRDSSLTIVPFNQGSKQDVKALVDYVYSNLDMDLDYILPFAAIPENGLLRLLGAVKNKKASQHIVTCPTQVILPLSPNHGLFGKDGLYSGSKISLETLFQRWNSESWGEYLCLAGAVIGWTRGTGLMDATNMVRKQVESYGVRTFSANEKAFNILSLMHPLLFSIIQVEPIWAVLNGGMDRLADFAEITTKIRLEINHQSDLCHAIARDNAADFKIVNGNEAERALQTVTVTPRANHRYSFPELEGLKALEELSKFQGLFSYSLGDEGSRPVHDGRLHRNGMDDELNQALGRSPQGRQSLCWLVIVTCPTQVILPLSPNHGLFGKDGLYSGYKISLETLFQRWNSESWGEYLCLAGAVIGWTRGTGLMDATNMVTQQVESYGVRTFSANEKAFNILGLMHPLLFSITQVEPIWAVLNGGMDRLADFAEITTKIRLEINHQSDLRRAITHGNAADFKIVNGNEAERALQTITVTHRANHRYSFPELEGLKALEELSNSRTRWEMKAHGQFTIEGCIEMAWMTISSLPLPDGLTYPYFRLAVQSRSQSALVPLPQSPEIACDIIRSATPRPKSLYMGCGPNEISRPTTSARAGIYPRTAWIMDAGGYLFHGSPRHWCTIDEHQDCSRDGMRDSRHRYIHFDIHVSVKSL
ncbi:hypothetical protein RSAG8_13015, partial [Rhizoctonia solani AG-8 WAC10335]